MTAGDVRVALSTLGFPALREVANRPSVADFFPADKRCGIYVLCFANDEVYVGQAVDVVRRYAQHRQNHGDITRLTFKRIARTALDTEERQAIWTLEQRGFRLRNITFSSLPKGDTDFDLLMRIEEQGAWLQGESTDDSHRERAAHEALRGRFRDKFVRLMRRKDADIALDALRHYVPSCIPVPSRSEVSFWACSCLPAYRTPGVTILSRINVYWQEVFTVAEENGNFVFTFNLARTPIARQYGTQGQELFRLHRGLWQEDELYQPGGHDQMRLATDRVTTVRALLGDSHVRHAARLFNLRLMRKGPCNFGRYHCLELADQLLAR